jgi:spermidine synthase
VDLHHPTYLSFEYVRRLGHLVDGLGEPGGPLAVVHLGAGGLTLARYVAATRPGSRQRAVEADPEVASTVSAGLPLGRGVRVPVQVADAREALGRMRSGSTDLVVLDVFSGARTPPHLTSTEMLGEVRRVLRGPEPHGVLAANVADGPPLAHLRSQVATALAVFRTVVLVVEPSAWRGRRFGNTVLLASDGAVPVDALARRVASDPAPARVVSGAAVRRFTGGAAPTTDGTAAWSPAPPQDLFGR